MITLDLRLAFHRSKRSKHVSVSFLKQYTNSGVDSYGHDPSDFRTVEDLARNVVRDIVELEEEQQKVA